MLRRKNSRAANLKWQHTWVDLESPTPSDFYHGVHVTADRNRVCVLAFVPFYVTQSQTRDER